MIWNSYIQSKAYWDGLLLFEWLAYNTYLIVTYLWGFFSGWMYVCVWRGIQDWSGQNELFTESMAGHPHTTGNLLGEDHILSGFRDPEKDCIPLLISTYAIHWEAVLTQQRQAFLRRTPKPVMQFDGTTAAVILSWKSQCKNSTAPYQP